MLTFLPTYPTLPHPTLTLPYPAKSNANLVHAQVEADIRPFRGLLLGLFFVTTGASLDVGLLLREWEIVLALLLGLIAVKILIIGSLAPFFGLTRRAPPHPARACSEPCHEAQRLASRGWTKVVQWPWHEECVLCVTSREQPCPAGAPNCQAARTALSAVAK